MIGESRLPKIATAGNLRDAGSKYPDSEFQKALGSVCGAGAGEVFALT